MKLIGINGRLRSGKDTAYEIIEAHASHLRVKRTAFADSLKMSAAKALGFDPVDVAEAVSICNAIKECGDVITHYSAKGNFKRVTGREYLQRYGTEAHRDVFGTDFWVDALLPRPSVAGAWTDEQAVANRYPGTDLLVVTDVRFDNEAKRIRDLGGAVWHINADDRLGPLPAGAHESEQGVSERYVTATVLNNTTLDEFSVNILDALTVAI